ncbi:hypothetical protein Pmani_010203 [Petrolisthes manimaculis]|uniref:Uncharacterized protein n=1 Tax=Petrolisthes manimaculis TaxID=1843537 RepID=A0AAE1Q1W4_9EUCA|nr:hypothetical protein Pmani_010203 [Petrolisthes manimaculis]
MLESFTNRTISPIKVITSQIVSLYKEHFLDHQFLLEVADETTGTLEYNGFNVMHERNQGQSVKLATTTDSDPPELDPTQYGWYEGEDGTSFYPTTLSHGVSFVPSTILQLIKCGCSTQDLGSTNRPCSTGYCGCVVTQMTCSMFCYYCNAGLDCCNECTRAVSVQEDDDDNEQD